MSNNSENGRHFSKLPGQGSAYQVILADPPWPYNRQRDKYGGGACYKLMSMEQIKALPVAQMCDPQGCLCFLWVTGPKLVEGLQTLEAWGFQYCTIAFTWVKTRGDYCYTGLGMWTRGNVELVLMGRRGAHPPPRVSTRVKQLIIAPVRRHSAKPDDIRRRIVDLVGPNARRIELFARYIPENNPEGYPASRFTEGWDSWGDGDLGTHVGLGKPGGRGSTYLSPFINPDDPETLMYPEDDHDPLSPRRRCSKRAKEDDAAAAALARGLPPPLPPPSLGLGNRQIGSVQRCSHITPAGRPCGRSVAHGCGTICWQHVAFYQDGDGDGHSNRPQAASPELNTA